MRTKALSLLLPSLLLGACGSTDIDTTPAAVGGAPAPVEAGAQRTVTSKYDKPGYATSVVDGRLWVFAEGSEGLAEFQETGEPAKSVTLIGAGPEGMTLRGDDKATMKSYMFAKPGYHTQVANVADREVLWVFGSGSESLEEFLETGEPAKSVTLIGAGPGGITLRGDDKATMLSYTYAKPGFYTEVAEVSGSRILWVFRDGSDAHAEFLASGEPAKNVSLIGQGPNGMTMRGADKEVMRAYMAR